MRQELYPNLYSSQEAGADGEGVSNLQTISEDNTELTDTNNEFTEDTSEAFGSDDEVRGGENIEDEEEGGRDNDFEDLDRDNDLQSDGGDGTEEVGPN